MSFMLKQDWKAEYYFNIIFNHFYCFRWCIQRKLQNKNWDSSLSTNICSKKQFQINVQKTVQRKQCISKTLLENAQSGFDLEEYYEIKWRNIKLHNLIKFNIKTKQSFNNNNKSNISNMLSSQMWKYSIWWSTRSQYKNIY